MQPNHTFLDNIGVEIEAGNYSLQDECSKGGEESSLFQGVVYAMYGSIFVLSLLGNSSVCYVVFSSTGMRTVTNYFIANLALGDMLMTCFCIPFSFVPVLILKYWPFPKEFCTVVSYSQAISVMVSAYTLVVISVDRYMAIIYPLRPRITRLQAKLMIVSVWIFAVLTSFPIALVSRLVQPDDRFHRLCGKFICTETWSTKQQQYAYSVVLLVLQYFLPVTVLILTYAGIAARVWWRKVPGETSNREKRMSKGKRKIIVMMVIVVMVFSMCWLPFHSLLIAGDQYPHLWTFKGIKYVWFAFHWLAMSHSCYNFLIYFCLNARFRSGFRHIYERLINFGKCCCVIEDIPNARYFLQSGNYSPNRKMCNLKKNSHQHKNQNTEEILILDMNKIGTVHFNE